MTEKQVERYIKQCARDGKSPQKALEDLCELLGFSYSDYYPNSTNSGSECD